MHSPFTHVYYCVYLCSGDTGLRGPVGEVGITGKKGAKGDQGDNIYMYW